VIVSGTGYVTGPRAEAGQRLEAHLKYIQYRAGEEGEGPRTVFGETENTLALREAHGMILDQGRDGLRFHKIVISPAESERVGDWHAFTRQVMDDLGQRVGLQLTWCATVHENTDHPHVHIVLAGDGERADGQVVQARLYTPHYDYLRERAQWHTEQAWDNIGEGSRREAFVAQRDEARLRSVGATYAAWTRYFEERRDANAKQQMNGGSCLSACGEMWAKSHGISDGNGVQARLIDKIGSPAAPTDLRLALAEEFGPDKGIEWRGGHLNLKEDSSRIFGYLTSLGPWIAIVEGRGSDDHAVMVDGVDVDGTVLIRDPWGVGKSETYVADPLGRGSLYKVPLDEFMRYWRGGIWGEHHQLQSEGA